MAQIPWGVLPIDFGTRRQTSPPCSPPLGRPLRRAGSPIPRCVTSLNPREDALVPPEVPSSEADSSYVFWSAAVRPSRQEGAIAKQRNKEKRQSPSDELGDFVFTCCLILPPQEALCVTKPPPSSIPKPKLDESLQSLKICMLEMQQVLDRNMKYKRESHKNRGNTTISKDIKIFLTFFFFFLNASFTGP